MDIVLTVMVGLLAGGAALAFYMDWLGLWVSKEEMMREVVASEKRMEESKSGTGPSR